MLDRKKQFIVEQALISSIAASVKLRQREFYKSAKVLDINQSTYDTLKKHFRAEFASFLITGANAFKKTSRDREKKLLAQIGWVNRQLNRVKGTLLADDQPTFGVSQKALNLFLKYLWCFRMINEPPHCPIDGQVLKRIKWTGVPWPLMTKKDYLAAIRQTKNVAGEIRLCEWELSEFKPSVQIAIDES
jgi:hypothetical protein